MGKKVDISVVSRDSRPFGLRYPLPKGCQINIFILRIDVGDNRGCRCNFWNSNRKIFVRNPENSFIGSAKLGI